MIQTGHYSKCHKVWTLETGQDVYQWCGKPATCQSSTTKPRHIKSNGRRKPKQAEHNGNGYDQLPEPHFTYYKVASQFSHKAQAQDREDLLHDIILTLANVERNTRLPKSPGDGGQDGHKPFTEAAMYRIASRRVADYWRKRASSSWLVPVVSGWR